MPAQIVEKRPQDGRRGIWHDALMETTSVERQRQDEQVAAQHARALATGERRALSRTVDGRLHSYAEDEVGFVRAGSGAIATSAAGMARLAAVFALIDAFSIFLFLAPTFDGGGDPLWGALLLTAGGAAGLVYASRLARAEARAKRIRQERGVPEPSSRQLD